MDPDRSGSRRGAPAVLRPLALLLFLPGMLLPGETTLATAQDRIVLRDARTIAGKRVAAFDEDGVRLEGVAAPIGWDEISSGVISRDQPRFDRLLKEVGDHLYRIKLRLRAGDDRDVLPHAEALFPRYAGRRSAAALLVCQGLALARIAHGHRELALEPFLRCLDLQRADPKWAAALPGTRRLPIDAASGLSPALLPVWFDPVAAKAALPGVRATLAAMTRPVPPGAFIHGATLALAAGDAPAAEALLGQVPAQATPQVRELVQAAAVQRELLLGPPGPAVAALEGASDRITAGNEPVFHYWLGLSRLRSEDPRRRDEGVLELLHLPALYGDSQPELAAAGLFHASHDLDARRPKGAEVLQSEGADALRSELLGRYPQTYFGMKARAEAEGKAAGPEVSRGES